MSHIGKCVKCFEIRYSWSAGKEKRIQLIEIVVFLYSLCTLLIVCCTSFFQGIKEVRSIYKISCGPPVGYDQLKSWSFLSLNNLWSRDSVVLATTLLKTNNWAKREMRVYARMFIHDNSLLYVLCVSVWSKQRARSYRSRSRPTWITC